MKHKRIMSLLMAAAFIIPFFNFNSLNVKAVTSGQPSIPVAVGQPYQTNVNGKTVTAQDYEVTVPFIDSNIIDNHYEQGYKDANEVLNKVPSTVTSTVNGQSVTFTKTNNVTFKEDDQHHTTFPKPVNNTMTVSCGTQDYALYQYAAGGYTISQTSLLNNFKNSISMGLIDSNTNGSFNGNYALVWCGDYSSGHIPILAAEAYQGFYPPITGGTTAPLKRRPYKVIADFTLKNKGMNLQLTTVDMPVFIDVPQGQNFDSSKSYEFDAITSNLLAFNYTATNGTNTYNHTSYTTLSNPLTSNDLKFFYPDYYDSSQYTTRKIVDVQGNKFSNAGTITRTNSVGVTQTVTRYTANIKLGKIEPLATYSYQAQEDLWLPTVTYKGTVYSDGPTPTPTPTPTTGAYTLNISYVDEDTDKEIPGYDTSKGYEDKDLNSGTGKTKWTYYLPTQAPSGYTLDTSKYKDTSKGYRIMFNLGADLGLNGDGAGNTANLKVYCKKDSTHVDPTPTPTPTIGSGTVIKRYFLDGVEQTTDEKTLTDVVTGKHTYSVDRSYPKYTCTNPTVDVDVTADSVTYCDFNFTFVNHPPTVELQAPSTVVMGDDFDVNASGVDPDGDSITYAWTTPEDFKGSTNNYTASGYFDSTGDKTFSVTATDPYEASGSDSKVVKVVPPIPNVVVDKSGNEKENRKVTLNAEKYSSSGSKGRYPLDWNKAKWQFFDGSGNELTVDSSPTSSTLIKSLNSTAGSKSMDLLFKKAGKYTAKCTLYNTAGYSNSFTVNLNITQDIAPTAEINLLDGNNIYRNPKDLSANGLSQATYRLGDSSSSKDNDSIGKRMWLACFDSDNDGNFIDITNNEDGTKKAVPEKERWYVFDLDYNGDSDTRYKVQVPDSTPLNGKLVTIGSDGHKYACINDSLNSHWRYVGSYDDVKKLDINKINCGNLTDVSFKTTSCGSCYFAEVVQESFGEETIPELITNNDKKQSNTFEF